MDILVLSLLVVVYSAMVFWFTWGILRTPSPNTTPEHKLPSISVIVPLRNEEKNVHKTMDALLRQQYAGNWEIICVNDRSSDSTPALLETFSKKHSNITILHIAKDVPHTASPKKRALELGFSKASHEILMTMDADCIPPTGWLHSMAKLFEPEVVVVQGPKKVGGGLHLLHGYQRLETLGLTAVEAAGFTLGKPLVASAAALAYRKSLFFQVGGFSDLMELASGDDDMLVHKMAQEPGKFLYNLDPTASVVTGPVQTLGALINQRARWASNGTHYRNHAYTIFLSVIYTFFCWLMISPLLAGLGILPWSWFWIPAIIKLLLDALFLICAAIRLQQIKDLIWYPLLAVLHIPLVVLAVPLGTFRLFRWK